MKLLGSRKKDVDQLSTISNYHQASKVLLTFVPHKQFGQLINI